MIEAAQFCQVRYRRFTFDSDSRCPASPRAGYGHSAIILVDRCLIPPIWVMDGSRIGGMGASPSAVQQSDPRWPRLCDACKQPFPVDARVYNQVLSEQMYSLPDGGLVELEDAPVGAMWHKYWADDRWAGPDGRCIEVMTPGGPWCIDTMRDGKRIWTRTGEPPNLTVTPSINCTGEPLYHGWLRSGRLEPA